MDHVLLPRIPSDLIALQREAYQASLRLYAWILAGPGTPPALWPLPRQREYLHLRAVQEEARQAVEEHPVMADAIARGRWDVTARALRDATREAEEEEAQAAA
jgi:hypothetical protein